MSCRVFTHIFKCFRIRHHCISDVLKNSSCSYDGSWFYHKTFQWHSLSAIESKGSCTFTFPCPYLDHQITGSFHRWTRYCIRPSHFLSIQRHCMLSVILMWCVSIIRGPIKAGGRGIKETCPSVKCYWVGNSVVIRARLLRGSYSSRHWCLQH